MGYLGVSTCTYSIFSKFTATFCPPSFLPPFTMKYARHGGSQSFVLRVVRQVCSAVRWLASQLVGWLVCWLVGWLVGWLVVGCLLCQSASSTLLIQLEFHGARVCWLLCSQLAGWLVGRLGDWWIYWVVGWLAWLAGFFTSSLAQIACPLNSRTSLLALL